MNKRGVIILSSLLIFFIVALSCGLGFTQITPDKNTVTQKYANAGYKTAKWDFGNYSIRTFTKDGNQVLVVWYGRKDLAEKSIYTANQVKGEKFAIKRGNAVAIGPEKDIRIFQFA